MSLLRHGGLDLPQYSFEEVLLTKEAFAQAASERRPDFVRAVVTSGPDETLAKRLERFAVFMAELSELCDVKVVEHSWGLSFIPAGEERKLHPTLADPILPKGYLLVAKVGTIVPVSQNWQKSLPERLASIETGEAAFHDKYRGHEDSYTETGSHQIMFGYPVSEPSAVDLWHVDIEPRVGKKELPLPDTPGFTNAKIIVR